MLFFSQLTAQDLQYIDLVLAGDLMNPIWSFEVGVELGFSVNQANGNPWPMILSSDGSDRNRHGHLQLRAPGVTQDTIAAVLSVVGPDGNPVPQLGEYYPPVTAVVNMVRVSTDESNENYTLFAEERNRFLVATTLPTSDVITAMNNAGISPDSAIILQDPPGDRLQFTLCDNCLGNELIISTQNLTVYPYLQPVDDIRIEMYVPDAAEAQSLTAFEVDDDNFVVKWSPPASGSGLSIGSPSQFFLFRLNHDNLDVILPPAAEVQWNISLERDFRTADNSCVAEGTPLLERHKMEPIFSYSTVEEAAWFIVVPGDVIPPDYKKGCGDIGNGKKLSSTPYKIKVQATLPSVSTGYSIEGLDISDIPLGLWELFEQSNASNVIVQEYWDHYPHGESEWLQKLLRKQTPSSNQVFTVPTPGTHYDGSSNCDGDCGPLVYGNYSDEKLSWGEPFAYADDIRAGAIALWGKQDSLLISSGWRNPERNEAIDGAYASNHQFGTAVDMKLPDTNVLVPSVYNHWEAGVAAESWCKLAKSAYDAHQPNEVKIENTRKSATGPRPPGVDQFYFTWDANSTLNGCESTVEAIMAQCLFGILSNENPDDVTVRRKCSPNHVHAAKK